MVLVYCITNKTTGKRYFGITCHTLRLRWKQHIIAALSKKRRAALQGAIRKYGPENFVVELIYEAVNESEARAVERGLIAQYGTIWPSGYNMSSGGEMRRGYRVNAATKTKMRDAALGRQIGDRQRALASKRMKELWADPEYRAIQERGHDTDEVRAAMKANNERQSVLRKSSPGFFKGRTHSDESKAKMSAKSRGRPAWNKGVPMSEAQKTLLVGIHTGKKQSEAQKAKRIETLTRPEALEANRQRMLARWADPEARAKMLVNRPCPRPKPPPLTEQQHRVRCEQMQRAGAQRRERNLRAKDVALYGASTAAVRAMVRELPAEYIARAA